jgi:hypothetical protein
VVGRPTAKIIDYTLKLSAVIKLAWLMVIEHTYLCREGRLGDELGRCRGEHAGLCKVSAGDDPAIHDVDRGSHPHGLDIKRLYMRVAQPIQHPSRSYRGLEEGDDFVSRDPVHDGAGSRG